MTPTQAHARLIYWLQSNPPPRISMFPNANEFEDAQTWWKEWAQQVGMFNGEYASHLAGSMPMNVDTVEAGRVIQEAVESTDCFCSLSDAAYQADEDARERELEGA